MVKVQRLFAKTNLKIRVCGAKQNNESPSGAFKRRNGLAAARWRGFAPTSSSLSGCPLRGEKSSSQRAFSIYTDIRKLQDNPKNYP